MRDHIKNVEYFDIFLNEELTRIAKFESKLKNNEVKEDRIDAVKSKLIELKLGVLIAQYSMGKSVDTIKKDYCSILYACSDVWRPSLYMRNLQIISLGILLNLKEEMKEVVLPLIISSNTKDWLYEYLIVGENTNTILFPEPYDMVKEIVDSSDANKSLLLEEYIKNKWYKAHNDCGWYDTHKSNQNVYSGYWSFEAGAIAKILKIDDEELKDLPYYPYDMVHFED